MWPYHSDLLERPVPRYTSYPTALEFGPVGSEFHASLLEKVQPDESLSLYVHIPFCDKICWYCGCNTGAANRRKRLTSYLDSLHREIILVAAQLNGRGKVGRIAFGGGSPNAISPVDFLRLLDHLLIAFDTPAPLLSIELDPRGFTDEWARVIRSAEITHVSLGVQTLSDRLQKRIGRVQPAAMIERTTAQLRASGISSLNFDLIYGLPGQSGDDLTDTLEQTVRLKPDRIALFGYAHLPDRIPRQRQIDDHDLPGNKARFRLAALGHEILTEAGYQPIGFDHFALPEDPLAAAFRQKRLHRNFQGFTDDASDHLVGLGASAISRIAGQFVQNEKNSGRYRMLIGDGGLPGTLGLQCTMADSWRGQIIENLLCHGEADLSALASVPSILAKLQPLFDRGLAGIDGQTLHLTEQGRPYARVVAHCFDRYRQSEPNQFSVAI